MWFGQSVSVILPTYRERDSIKKCIQDFQELGYIDEILVVNNNAEPGTSEEVALTTAREVFEPIQGYGAAIQRGLNEARGDLLIVCEPDDTFQAYDAFKLLAYVHDYDFVVGSRTAKEFIWQGANMGHFLKWGNYAVAKLMEVLFNTVSLTDVGCTYRIITRRALEAMQPRFTIRDNYFGPEMMLLACVLDIPLVQIPVNYRARIGESAVTGNPVVAFRLGLRMIRLILSYKLKHDGLRRKRRFRQRSASSASSANSNPTPTDLPTVPAVKARQPR